MKTKPTSIRFDENDLSLAMAMSGIKKPQKLVDLLISEYVKTLKGKPLELPKDYMNPKYINVIQKDGTVSPLIPNEWLKTNEEKKRRISELENELKDPPKNPIIGQRKWIAMREKELKDLKSQLPTS